MRCLFLPLLCLPACGGGGSGGVRIPDVVAGVAPAPYSSGIDPDSNVTITFQEDVDGLSLVRDAFELADARGPIPHHSELASDRRTVTLVPNDSLGLEREVRVWVSGMVRLASGQSLGSGFGWSFFTREGRWSVAPPPPGSGLTYPVHSSTGMPLTMVGNELWALPDVASGWTRIGSMPLPPELDRVGVTFLAIDGNDNLTCGAIGVKGSQSYPWVLRSRGISAWWPAERVSVYFGSGVIAYYFIQGSASKIIASSSWCITPSRCGGEWVFAEPATQPPTTWDGPPPIFDNLVKSARDVDGKARFFALRLSSQGVLDGVFHDPRTKATKLYPLASAMQDKVFDLRVLADSSDHVLAIVGRVEGGSHWYESYRLDESRGFLGPAVFWSGTAPPHGTFVGSPTGHALYAVETQIDNNTWAVAVNAYDPATSTWSPPVTLSDRAQRSKSYTGVMMALAFSSAGDGMVVLPQRAGGGRPGELLAFRHVPGSGFGAPESMLVLPGDTFAYPTSQRLYVDARGRATLLCSFENPKSEATLRRE